jgi:hypothetical protein
VHIKASKICIINKAFGNYTYSGGVILPTPVYQRERISRLNAFKRVE